MLHDGDLYIQGQLTLNNEIYKVEYLTFKIIDWN